MMHLAFGLENHFWSKTKTQVLLNNSNHISHMNIKHRINKRNNRNKTMKYLHLITLKI